MFASDSYFHIGYSHLGSGQPCQDYSLHGELNNQKGSWIVVSDGCSTGGNTDMGARILSFSTSRAIKELLLKGSIDPWEVREKQKFYMAGIGEALGLSQKDLLATCLWAQLTEGGGSIHVLGDGVVALVKGDETHLFKYEWSQNLPLYPVYSSDNFESFVEAHGGDLNSERFTREHWVYTAEGQYLKLEDQKYQLGDALFGSSISVDTGGLDYILLASDGVCQVDGTDWKDVTRELLAFKTTKGSFLKRRAMRFIKESQKVGRGPIDDISCAAIKVTD